MLIAGCGTGHQVLLAATRYPDNTITALDISRPSLAYASRKAREYGKRKIRFFQADLHAVDRLDHKFDVIECTGVLHHLADPKSGWQVLADCFGPNGVMKIALYSKAARRSIRAAQSLFSSGETPSHVTEFRQARQVLRRLPDSNPAKDVVRFTDFYSKSGLKDLLFHEQEAAYDLSEIRQMVNALSLKMIGMQMPSGEVERQYSQMFPDDANRADFESLAAFENHYPDTFSNMYVLWCRKADGSQ